MMLRPLLLLAAGLAVVAVMVPDFAARYLGDPAPAVEVALATEEDGDHDATPQAGYRTAVLKADARGHFIGTFTINGRKIDGIRVSDVGAMVLDDAALSGTLIGMSFLKALSSYQVAGREMRLTQ